MFADELGRSPWQEAQQVLMTAALTVSCKQLSGQLQMQ